MVNSRLETQRQTIYHYWLNGVQSPKEIHRKTNIPYRTVLDNLKKLRDTGTIEHKKGNGRSSNVVPTIARAVGQRVRRNIVPLNTSTCLCHKENTKYFHFTCCNLATCEKKRSMRVLYLVHH